VIGAGFWAPTQISGWQEIPGVTVVGVIDREFSRARKVSSLVGSVAYESIAEMVEKGKPDVLDIVTSPGSHLGVFQESLPFGLPIICQKPLADSFTEAREMVMLAEKAGVPLLVNENWRYQAPIQALAKSLEEGVIGQVKRARIQFSTSFPVFENQPFLAAIERFILADVGSHLFDTARFLFGEATEVYARVGKINPMISGEDIATVILKMTRCDWLTVELSYGCPWRGEAFPQTFFFVEGSLGILELKKDYRLITTTKKRRSETVVAPHLYDWVNPDYLVVHSSIVACQEALVADLRGEGRSGLRGSENLRSMALVEAAYESAQTGKPVLV
jgi:predicted dehydrogenase